MPRSKLVVSNTSPILNLAIVDRLELLRSQFPGVVVPEHVWMEVQEGGRGKEALEQLRETGFLTVEPTEEDELFHELLEGIDVGEAAAIRHSLQRDADLLLLDEKEARTVARRHETPCTGVIGVLLKAEADGEIDALERELDSLRDAGFWISDDLYRSILEDE